MNKYKRDKISLETNLSRLWWIRAVIILCFSFVIIKLFYMQVLHNRDYKKEASMYQDAIESVSARRGEIYVLADKNVDIDSMNVYNYSNIDKLDKIVANVYKYNVIFNPKALYNSENLANTLISYLGKNITYNKEEIISLFEEYNDPYEITENLIRIIYPEIYKYSENDEQIKKWKTEKESIQSKLNITKNEKTKKELENSLYIVNMELDAAYKDEEISEGVEKLNSTRETIISKITKENDGYEVIKRDISESQREELIEYFQESISEKFSYYILQLTNETKIKQIKNIYKAFVSFEENNGRIYSDSSIFSQITGFMKVKERDENGKIYKYNEGEYGVEGAYNELLTGKDGVIKGTYDKNGRLIATAEKTIEDAEDGKSLVLTIDKSIQYNVCKELQNAVELYEAENGSAIVINPNTGEILSMCNVPTFDANNFGKVDDISVYNNPIVSDQIELGSIMKVMTMAAGIDSGAVTTYSTYNDKGCEKIGDWKEPICNSDSNARLGIIKPHGETDMVTVLDKSLNLGSYYVAKKTGVDNFKSYLDKFGFGKKTGIDLGNEAKGDLRNLDNIKNESGDIYLANASFGQGITITQLQYV